MIVRSIYLSLFPVLLLIGFSQPVAAGDDLADRVIVRKAERKLVLMRGAEVLREYPIALGLMPDGPKQREGDFRTPEGEYRLTRRRWDSDYFMAIQISYPSAADMERARKDGVSAGSYIMIHGQPDEPRKSKEYYANTDWTDGCIAVSNSAMVDIWQLTVAETPITIVP